MTSLGGVLKSVTSVTRIKAVKIASNQVIPMGLGYLKSVTDGLSEW